MINKKTLALTVACFSLCLPAIAEAETTVTTKTYVEPQKMQNVKEINFSAFDTNKDGLYAKSEVGKKLFYSFDADGNEVIDNIEWDMPSVFTIVPMEKETYTFVDYNSDGYTELSTYTYDQFYQESALIVFDENKNGLSAAEFIEVGFQELDSDDNGTIELDEWEDAYLEMTQADINKEEQYN